MRIRSFLLASMLLLSAAAPVGDPLPRSVALGVAGTPQPAGGLRVERIVPALTAQAVGLREGDVLLEVNGTPVADMPAVARAAGTLKAGAPLTLTVVRDGRRQQLSGKALPRPYETYSNGVVAYGTGPFRGGLLRDIMVTPRGGAKGPVVFLIQGYTCDPVETSSPDTPHRLLIDGLLARGISTYRIEKPQAGDSRGGPACSQIDFDTEVAGFETGYRTLIEKHGVAPDRIFMLGHSMGGIQAPLLAARGPTPRGVAVYGTVMRNWYDYNIDLYRTQGVLAAGADPAESEAQAEDLRELLRGLLLDRKTPAQLAADPKRARRLRELLDWSGGDQVMGRHYGYWQGLASQRLAAAWRDTRSNVLSVFGEGDIAAVDNRDHRFIVDVVNHYRPGTARFVEVPRTGHGMTIDGSLAELRQAARAGGRRPRPPFNPAMVGLFADWIEASMREAPVAARYPAAKR
jgi:pimeloyl-ACP methyl ester carboxylesterase